jgi:hypothetical protein
MSTKAPVKTPAKTPAAPAAARIPQPPVAEPEHVAERPDIAAQLEGADRLGHSLGAVSVDRSAPPIIQRQEIPEEEEEEPQLKREPAAIQRQELPEEEEEEEELQQKPEPAALQRQELPEEEEEELQTKPANGVQRQGGSEGVQLDDETAGRINRARGGGQPLEGVLQEQMSASLGHDFSRVRVHTDAEADALNQQLQAKAFTTGPDIFFKRGAYDPGSSGGRELIAHELSHVVQQSTGVVRGGGPGMTVRPAGDAFEQQAAAGSRSDGRRAHDNFNRVEPRAMARSDVASPADILARQRRYGKRAVQRLPARREGPSLGVIQRLSAEEVERVHDELRRSDYGERFEKYYTRLAVQRRLALSVCQERSKSVEQYREGLLLMLEKARREGEESHITGMGSGQKREAIQGKEPAVVERGAIYTAGGNTCVQVGMAVFDTDGIVMRYALSHYDGSQVATVGQLIIEMRARVIEGIDTDRWDGEVCLWVIGGPSSGGASGAAAALQPDLYGAINDATSAGFVVMVRRKTWDLEQMSMRKKADGTLRLVYGEKPLR